MTQIIRKQKIEPMKVSDIVKIIMAIAIASEFVMLSYFQMGAAYDKTHKSDAPLTDFSRGGGGVNPIMQTPCFSVCMGDCSQGQGDDSMCEGACLKGCGSGKRPPSQSKGFFGKAKGLFGRSKTAAAEEPAAWKPNNKAKERGLRAAAAADVPKRGEPDAAEWCMDMCIKDCPPNFAKCQTACKDGCLKGNTPPQEADNRQQTKRAAPKEPPKKEFHFKKKKVLPNVNDKSLSDEAKKSLADPCYEICMGDDLDACWKCGGKNRAGEVSEDTPPARDEAEQPPPFMGGDINNHHLGGGGGGGGDGGARDACYINCSKKCIEKFDGKASFLDFCMEDCKETC